MTWLVLPLLVVWGVDSVPNTSVPEQASIGVGLVKAEVTLAGGKLETKSFTAQIAPTPDGQSVPSLAPLALSTCDEFVLTLEEGREVTTRDYRVTRWLQKIEGEEESVVAELSPLHLADPHVTIEWRSRRGAPWLRKRLRVSGPVRVESVAVSAWQPEVRLLRGGGFGQPVWLDNSWFVGLQHPAGDAEIAAHGLECRQFPGRREFESAWQVIGVVPIAGMRVEDAFERYLESLRPAPDPSLQYNSWFDRRGSEINPEQSLATYELFKRHLLLPHDLRFDAFCIDDGWQDPDSLWGYSSAWKEGLAPLARHLESERSRLGLWLPLNGYSLSTAFGSAQGWKVATGTRKNFYCLADPAYASRLRKVLEERLREGNLACLKHDFNFLRCQCDQPSMSTAGRQDLEACVDAQIALLDFERTVVPDVLLNVTSNLWPSPWWFVHADTIWMGGADYDVDRSVPHSGSRAAEMTYRDGKLYERLVVDRLPIPASRLMTHGIIRGRYDGTEPLETRAEWSDYVVMFFGRGTLLQELYISPERMPPEFWPVLGRTIQWAHANAKTLAHTRMIGGDPRHGEPYGYIHWSADRGIAVLRNPSPLPATMTLTTRERPRDLPRQKSWTPLIIYPHRERLAPMAESMEVSLPSDSVVVVELDRELPPSLREIPEGRFTLEANEAGGTAAGVAPLSMRWSRAGRLESDKKEDEQRFVRAPSGGPIETTLDVFLTPARGLSWQLHRSEGEGRTTTWRRLAEEPTGKWEWRRYALSTSAPGQGEEIAWEASLPPSPFYPQQAEMSVVLRQEAPQRTTWQQVYSASTALPAWPQEKHPARTVREEILTQSRPFYRHRHPIEELAWGGLILTIGVMVVSISGRLLGRSLGPAHGIARGAITLAAALAVGAVVYWTPVGTALSRLLQHQ